MGGPEPVSIAGVAVADVDLHRRMLACEVAGVIAEGVDTPVMGAVDGSFRRDCSAMIAGHAACWSSVSKTGHSYRSKRGGEDRSGLRVRPNST